MKNIILKMFICVKGVTIILFFYVVASPVLNILNETVLGYVVGAIFMLLTVADTVLEDYIEPKLEELKHIQS